MPVELTIPEVGESITEVQISEWLKQEGDSVNQDDAIAVIDSEKTTFELPAPRTGRLSKILHQAGETVAVGEAVAQLEPDDETGSGKAAEAGREQQPAGEAKATAAKGRELSGNSDSAKGKSKIEKAEPLPERTEEPAVPAKQAARQEPSAEPPKANRKNTRKAETGLKAAPAAGTRRASAPPAGEREEEVVPMTMLRRTVARRLVEARQTMAMLTTFNEVDLSAVQALRRQHGDAFEKRYQVRLGLMSFFVKAAIDALKQHPKINAEVREADIVYRNYFDIAVAIATERGLVVPVLHGAERLSFAEVEKAIGDFAQRVREGKLQPDELEGGTFTITNGGVFGSLLSTPIINPPQSGILGMHTIQDRPVAVDGQVVIRPMMYLALTYDHRLVDGREAVLFLRRVKESIENPARMLIEI